MSGFFRTNTFIQNPYETSGAVGGDAANPVGNEVARPANESPNARANVINNICKGTLEPDLITTSPVPRKHPQVMKVQMKESSTFRVVAPYPNPNNQVSADSSTGLILVDWKTGPSTGVWHMGILDAGGIWRVTDAYDPGLASMISYSSQPLFLSGLSQITFNKALALPYNKSSGKQLRIVSTNLANNFTRSRGYSSRLTIVSDTVQLNAAIAAGNVTASVITESPGVSQNAAGDDCYSVSDIVNGSRWKPETVQAHSLMDGVTVVQGPDIPEELAPVDQVNRNLTDGAWQSIAAQIGWDTGKVATIPLTAPYGADLRCVFNTWISPWGINGVQQNGFALMGSQYNNGYFDPIPEMQMVSVRVRAPYYATGVFVNTTTFRASLTIEHVFGSLNANGQLVIDTIADVKDVGSGSLSAISLGPVQPGNNLRAYNMTGGMIDVVSDPRSEYVRRRNNGKDVGKYIGTQVTMNIAIYNSTGADPPFNFRIGGVDGVVSDHAENIFEVCAVSLNTDLSGPLTVVRYDEVAIGQNIRVNSVINTDNLSKSALSVITANDMYDTCYDINIYSLLNSLYFGPHTDFRCVWTNSNYKRVLAKLNKWQLSDLIDTVSRSPRTMQIAEAAGLFDGLKSFGRGLLGMGRKAMGNPMVRQFAESAIDGAANHLSRRAKDFISQSGDTDGGSASGYFGDEQWGQ